VGHRPALHLGSAATALAALVIAATPSIAHAAPGVTASGEPRLSGLCPTDQFYSISGAHHISVTNACSIGIAARQHGAVECYSPPGSEYPVDRAARRSFRRYSLKTTLYGIRFARRATRFFFGIQCS